jgi:hypothetical protein
MFPEDIMTRRFSWHSWKLWLAPCALAIVPVILPMREQSQPQPAATGTGTTVPVVVELFTSEGCSSCPPADDLLTILATKQPVPGVQIIALGEHVDYWDHQGWRDQYGSAKFTERQTEYAQRVFGPDQVYTPQVVVDGAEQALGNDANRVTAAIAKSATNQTQRVTLKLTPTPTANGDQSLTVKIDATIPDAITFKDKADVLLALTEDNLASQVQRGENKGRELHHNAVVRTLVQAGTIANGQRTWSATQQLKRPSNANASHIHVIAFVQDRTTKHILGASSCAL